MKKYDVYGLGAALVDTEIEVEDQFLELSNIDKGLMTLVDEARQYELLDKLSGHMVASRRASGGSAANSIIASSYFGASAFYSCKVANDDNGFFYLEDLQNAGVDSNLNGAKEEGITGKCLVMITPDAERTMNTFLGISETLSVNELDLEALENSRYLYMEGYLVTSPTGRNAAIKAREYAEQHGVKTAFSLSDPGMVEFFKDGLAEIIGKGVDLLFCNEDEAMGWADVNTIEEAIEEIKKIAKGFAITRGAKGAVVWNGENLLTIAPNKVKAIDTNGAGDMFAGAFLYALSQGHDFQVAGDLASLASATIVSEFGPRMAAEKHQQVLKQVLS
jgi:sugar/nucleoside kinase (ribokinase family)